MAARDAVGIYRVRVNFDVWNTVRTRGFDGAGQVDRRDGFHRSIRTAIPKRPDLSGNESPVFFHTGLHDDNARMARVRGHELFSIRHDHSHRPARPLREKIGERQIHESSLAAEVAADGREVNDNFFCRHADRV